MVSEEDKRKEARRKIKRERVQGSLDMGGFDREAWTYDTNKRHYKTGEDLKVHAYVHSKRIPSKILADRSPAPGTPYELDRGTVFLSRNRFDDLERGVTNLKRRFLDTSDTGEIEKNRPYLMGAARELLRAGEEFGDPRFSVLGAQIYERLGVNADSIVRRSLRDSLKLSRENTEIRKVSNPKYSGLIVTGDSNEPEFLERNRYHIPYGGFHHSDSVIQEARDMLSKYDAKHSASTQKAMTGILSIIGFSGGVGLLGGQLTGNVIDSATNSDIILKAVGVGLFLLGIISFFVYVKKSKG